MNFSIAREVYILFYSVLAGAVISLLFDLFKTIRKKTPVGIFLTSVQDIVFWILATSIMFFLIYRTNNGRIRWYHIFGAFSGASLYSLTLSRYAILMIDRFLSVFFKIFEVFFKILLTPLKISYKIICVCLSFVITPILRVYKKLAKKISFTFFMSFKHFKRVLLKK